MVDPDPVVLLPGAALIVPEGVDVAILGRRPERVGEAERFDPAQRLPGRRLKKRVVDPCRRVLRVDRLGNHVVVAGKHQRLLQRQPLLGP